MKDLKDRVAAITGAGSGIGRALAQALAAEGCHLALSDVDEASLADTASRVKGAGVKVHTARVDVADRGAMHAWASAVSEEFGRVNLIFNNAGVALSADVKSMSYEDFEWLMGINFWGVVHGTKEFLPLLEASGEGHIVNISSIFGIIGVPTQSAYNSAKFAVRGFTEALRQELKLADSKVSATSIHPGGIKTSIVKNARLGVVDGEQATREDAMEQFDSMARTTPEEAARQILAAVRGDERRALVGWDAQIMDGVQRLLPTHYQWVMEKLFSRRREKPDSSA